MAIFKEDDLRHLASQRALAVKGHMMKPKQVESERIFVIKLKTVRPEKKKKSADGRIDFNLE